MGVQLLVRFVPMVWETFLPGGLKRADYFVGWPALIWRLALLCHAYEWPILGAIAVGGIVGLGVCSRSRACRWLARLAALAVIALDAGIVLVTLLVSYRMTADASGIPAL